MNKKTRQEVNFCISLFYLSINSYIFIYLFYTGFFLNTIFYRHTYIYLDRLQKYKREREKKLYLAKRHLIIGREQDVSHCTDAHQTLYPHLHAHTDIADKVVHLYFCLWCIHTHTQIQKHTAFTYAYTQALTRKYAHAFRQKHMHTCIHTYKNAHTRVHTHTSFMG